MFKEMVGSQPQNFGCIECGSVNVAESMREQKFAYGKLDDQVILTASMPVFTCQDCGFEYFDERGEISRHEAVCKHLGVCTPQEVRAIREATGLSRIEFCELTGVGSASLQRWETGMIVPNSSSDKLLRLLMYRDNLERLKARSLVQKGDVTVHLKKAASSAINQGVPEVRVGHKTRRFPRLKDRPRVASQAERWCLRAH